MDRVGHTMDAEMCMCLTWWRSCCDVVWKSLNLAQKTLGSTPGSVIWHWANHPHEEDPFICGIELVIMLWLIVWIRLSKAFESIYPGIGTNGSLYEETRLLPHLNSLQRKPGRCAGVTVPLLFPNLLSTSGCSSPEPLGGMLAITQLRSRWTVNKTLLKSGDS